jgi:hypothetical protein
MLSYIKYRIKYSTIFPALILTTLLWTHNVLAEEIQFQGIGRSFMAAKDNTTFSFRDDLGRRSIEIQKCNKELIESLWSNVLKSINDRRIKNGETNKVNTSLKKTVKTSVSVDLKKYQLLPIEKTYKYLNSLPMKVHLLFVESRRLCPKS